jgi:hypothetical protein
MIVFRRFVCGLALTGALLAACGSVSSVPATPSASTTLPADATLSLPSPADSRMAVIGGVLLRLQPDGNLAPISDITLYLAPVVYTSDHREWLVGLDEAADPKTSTNQTGVFVFSNIAPGKYGLVLKTPVGGFLLKKRDGEDLLIEAVAGQSLNLGEVITDLQY